MTYYAYVGTQNIALPDGITDAEAARNTLKLTNPEVKNATVNTKVEGENTVFEFVPKAGRKG